MKVASKCCWSGWSTLALILLFLEAAPVQSQTVKIDVASTASLFPQFYPLAVAQELGYFGGESIAVHEVATGGGGATVAPVISGDTPIGLASMSATMLAALRGAPIKVVSGVSPNFLATIVFAVPADSDLHRLAELAGRKAAKIGYTSGGSITDTASSVAVKADRLREGTDVVRVALGSMQAVTAALLTRQIEVAVANVNAVADSVVKGRVRIIADTSDYMKNYEANAVIANARYLEKQNDVVRRFLRAYSKAVKYGNAQRDWVQKLYAKKTGTTLEAAGIVLKNLSWTTSVNYQGFNNQLELLKQIGQVKRTVDTKQLWDGLVELSLLPQ